MMETIQGIYSDETGETLENPLPANSPCCAQWPEDEKWHRAVIERTENDSDIVVKLIDLGNIVTIPLTRLRSISDELVTCLPPQALHCSLVDLEPVDEEWSADAVKKMSDVCAGKELEGIFRSRHREKYLIYLHDVESDASNFVNKLLVDEKLAKVTGRDLYTTVEVRVVYLRYRGWGGGGGRRGLLCVLILCLH